MFVKEVIWLINKVNLTPRFRKIHYIYNYSFKNNLSGYLFVLPAIIFLLVLILYPIIYNFVLSFQNATVSTLNSSSKEFIEFNNYKEIIYDNAFKAALRNTFIYTIACIIFQFIIGFMLALFFTRNFKLASFLRGLTMIGWMIPIVVTAAIYKWMFDSSSGVINYFLSSIGIKPVEWLTNTGTALWGVIIANIWIGIPFNMILLSAGLTTLPVTIYEAADIDGASKIQKFFYITVPLLFPTIKVVLALGFLYTFKVFDLIYAMTGGGPVNSTEVLATLSYKYSFVQFNFGYGAATANVLFIILFAVGLLYLKFTVDEEVNR
ncbi:MAG TPA: sugar ABC transporter permease [Thermoanaerobacterium sp.]|nr:sugar ABC transporter permease [Thermoanaerobacterium sp.]